MNLTSVGYYKEMPQGKESDPSIYEFINRGEPQLKEKICAYLDEGIVVIVCPGVTRDIVDENAGPTGTGSACTDGTWLWPDDLSYYVSKYNISIPEAFLETMKVNNWKNSGEKLNLADEPLFIDGEIVIP